MLTSKAILTAIAFILDFECSKPTFSLLCEKNNNQREKAVVRKKCIYTEKCQPEL